MTTVEKKFFYDDQNFLLVVRSFFDPVPLKALREKILLRIKGWTPQKGDARQELAEELGIAPDEARLHQDYFDIWKTAGLQAVEPSIGKFDKVTFPPQVRTVRDRKSFVPWHQDEAYMLAMGPRAHKEVITVFLPLNDQPVHHPSLEFVNNPEQGPVRHITRPGYVLNSFDLPDTEKPHPSVCLTPELKFGDVFIFGKRVLHQTWFPEGDFQPRLSMEFRVTTPASMISGKDYYDLKTQRFMLKE